MQVPTSEHTALLSPELTDAKHKPYQKHIFTLFVFLLITEGSSFLQLAPMTVIMESIICKNYYQHANFTSANYHPGSDARCKIEPVQSELAKIRGWQQLFDCLASILVALPFGNLANKYGGKLALSLAMFGLTIARAWIQAVCWWTDVFPLRLTWVSSLFILIGGGNLVAGSLIYSIMTDLTTQEQRASVFMFMNAAVLLSEVLMMPLASAAMQKNPWLPVNSGLVTLAVGSLVTLIILPETSNLQEESRLQTCNNDPPEAVITNSETSLFSRTKAAFLSLGNPLGLTWISREAVALVMVSTITNMDRISQPFFLQYVSKQFSWDISHASLLMSYRAVLNLVLLTVLFPMASHVLLTKFNMVAEKKDIYLTRFSASVLCIGTFLMAVAPNIIFFLIGLTIFAHGYGLSALVHSLAGSVVDQRHIVMIYNAMAVAETTGDLISGPMLAGSFTIGQRLGENWWGLFFMAMAVFYLAATVVVWIIRYREHSSR